MKHAIIIMAHKNLEQLCHLVEYFSRDCYVFIHLDTKFRLSHDERERLRAFPQVVKVCQRFNVHWGGYSILRCEMYMLREVLRRCDAEYVHLISGQDYPMKPLEEFLLFFEQHRDKDCMQYVHLPQPGWEQNTFRRFSYFFPYDCFRDSRRAGRKIHKIINFQRRHNLRRPLPTTFEHLYGCSQWFSITRTSTQMLVNYTRRHPWLYWRMWMTFAPEETYPATVLANLKGGRDILFTNFRFIRWKLENGNRPANLGTEHLRMLMEGNYAFVRKIEMPVSRGLISLIDRYFVYDNQPLHPMPCGGWDYDGYSAYTYDPMLLKAVVALCKQTDTESVVDAGCGCGMYVAMLREQGIAATGFDANPYVEELSARLLPNDEEPCVQADLLDDELETDSGFDLVICHDVLPYIPADKTGTALSNLARLSGRYILLSWREQPTTSALTMACHTEQDITATMESNGYKAEKKLTQMLANVEKAGALRFMVYENENEEIK